MSKRDKLHTMIDAKMPPTSEMYKAFIGRDSGYDGVFYTAVRTTGIFCRPSCPAKKPNRKNVEFFHTVPDAVDAGYRPCKRCRPADLNGNAPPWIEKLIEAVEREPGRRWTDNDLREMSIDPSRVRRWFHHHHGMTFHAYQRARRLGLALAQIRQGAAVTGTAYDHGYESLSGFREAFGRVFGAPPGQRRNAARMTIARILTPLGPMVAGATDDGICLLEFADRQTLESQLRRLKTHLDCVVAPGDSSHISTLEDELTRYFGGTLRHFTVPVVAPGTDFQQAAWSALRAIPYGETRTYEEQARSVGRPAAVRAVGRANGDNRIAIVIPCHRVIRGDGTLSGYGGGVWRKKFLIDLERANV